MTIRVFFPKPLIHSVHPALSKPKPANLASSQRKLCIFYEHVFFPDPPEVLSVKPWIHTAPGHRAQLECIVSSDPPATITWFKGEIPISKDSRVISLINGEKHTLLIRNVQPNDFDVYTCRARNELGEGETHMQLSGKH